MECMCVCVYVYVWLHYSWPDGPSGYSWSGGFGKFPPDDNFNANTSASVCEIKLLYLHNSWSRGAFISVEDQ